MKQDILKEEILNNEQNVFVQGNKKLSSFISIGKNIFTFNFIEKYKLQKSVDKLMQMQSFDVIFKFLENGYQLTRKQSKNFEKSLLNDLNNLERYSNHNQFISFLKKLEFLLAYNFNPSIAIKDTLLNIVSAEQIQNLNIGIDFFQDEEKIIKYNKKKYPLTSKVMRNYVNQENKLKNSFNNLWYNFVSCYEKYEKASYDDRGKLYIQFEVYKDRLYGILNSQNHQIYLKEIGFHKACEINIYMKAKFKLDITGRINNVFENHINNLLETTKKQYTKEYIESKTINSIETERYKLRVLPKEAQDILFKIEKTYNKMPDEFKEKDFECKSLFEKTIPDILKKYLLLDENYRDQYLHKTSGLTPTQTLLESLNNIYGHIEKKWLNINEDRAIDLNIVNRYTKNYKP